jgi:Recombinase
MAVRDRLLMANETEATLVRRIFDDFVAARSATLMAKTCGAEGVVTKGGKPFTKQTIYKMLHNRMYLDEIVHKGQSFPGQHQAIITQAQWDAVHALIATDGMERPGHHGRAAALVYEPAVVSAQSVAHRRDGAAGSGGWRGLMRDRATSPR